MKFTMFLSNFKQQEERIVKQMRREMTSLVKSLKTLTEKVEKMINKIDAAEKTQAKPKKPATPKKAAKKTAKPKKATSIKKAAKELAAKKASKKSYESRATQQMSDKVLDIIQSSPDGVTTDQIIEQTGLSKRQVWGIVSRAKKAGKIAAVKRGSYMPGQS